MASTSALSRPPAMDGPPPGETEFDDLDNYDVGDEDDPFSDNYKPLNKKDTENPASMLTNRNGAGLGIDEEIEVSKKIRAPRVKLDEHRLLSAAGIPKLRRKAKDLKFKGKGHEYSDAARLLAFYQLWLDDLFPKARFLDALAMVEKTGHKRQLQAMRMEWINEGKPRSSVHEDSIFDQPTLPPRLPSGQEKPAPPIAPIFQKAATDRPKTPTPDSNMEMEMEMEVDDLYDATPKAPRQNQAAAQSQNSIFGGGIAASGSADVASDADGPLDDDLDALLAEEEMIQAETSRPNAVASGSKSAVQEDSFEDDMEAMAEMEGLW